MTMTSSPPTHRARIALALGSTVLALLLAEGLLRLLSVGAPGRGTRWFAGGNHPRFLVEEDAECGYALRPGFVGREVSTHGEFEVPVTIDERGLRDHRHTAPAGPSILALGDSMTFGEGVTAEEAFPALLEAETGRRVENGGVPGYRTAQMACRLRRLLPVLRPELVVITFLPSWDRARCANPFVHHEGFLVASSWRDRLHLVGGNLYPAEVGWPLLGPLTAQLEGRSYLARLTLPALRRLPARLRGVAPGPAASAVPIADCFVGLLAARSEAERAGARLVVMLIESAEPGSAEDTAAAASFLGEHGLEPLLLDRLLAGQDLERLRFPVDRHWNAEGHRAVARALAFELGRLGPR